MTDGWEYKSALDLNARSCPVVEDYPVACDAVKPYPARRPYPNPMFADETRGGFSAGDWWQQVYEEPPYKNAFIGTDWLDRDSDGDGTIDGLDDQDDDDFLNVEEVTRGFQSRTNEDRETGVRTGLWVDPFNPCLPSVESRTCATTLLLDAAAWRPFKKGGDPDPLPRRPLYPAADRTWKYYGYLPYNPADPGPDPDGVDGPLVPNPDTTPTELWKPPAGHVPGLPPLHPLPR